MTRSQNQLRVGKRAIGVIRPVAQYSLEGKFIAVYKNATEAMRATGANSSTIIRVASKVTHRKTAGGFKWEFITEEEYEKYFNNN